MCRGSIDRVRGRRREGEEGIRSTVCLTEDKGEDKGEEQALIVWEEVIKEWDEAREFKVEMDQTQRRTRDCTVQTEER